jgi:serine/threonine-protein kinase
MGEVYRAQDARLGRAVAIKVLPEALAVDGHRIARLEREARVLASLNHPHIASLFGFEEANSRQFIVMELVEGDTLADRLARGAIPVDESLRIARQIVEALEAAHEKGVVHRDLKPANIKVTPEDRVKVLDFGLARLQEPDAPDDKRSTLTHSPTLSVMATQAGIVLGTAGYMSPEQAKGAAVDHRSDLFSFGLVLYEMLAGRRAFQADTAAETMAAVLMRDADVAALPPNLNPRLVELLSRCLEKNPRRRWQAAGDLRAEIETVAATPLIAAATSIAPAQAQPLWRRALPLVAAAVIAALLTGAAAWRFLTRADVAPVVAFSMPIDDTQLFALGAVNVRWLAVSHDGRRTVFGSTGGLWVRDLSNPNPLLIAGTENSLAVEPTFSPRGDFIAFYSGADKTLKRVSIRGGTAFPIAAAQSPISVTWGGDSIFFAQPSGIMRVSPTSGGKPERVIELPPGQIAQGLQLLPDARTLLFAVTDGASQDTWDKADIVAQALGSTTRKKITVGSQPRYLPSGHLLYAVGGVLFAAQFDVSRLEMTSGPAPVVEGVARNPLGAAQYDVSNGGTLAYIPGAVQASSGWGLMTIALLDDRGSLDVLKLPVGRYEAPRISPNGKHVAFGLDDGRQSNVWIYDLDGTTAPRKLTVVGNNRYPVWSPDSARVAFQSDRAGDAAIFVQRADVSGTGAERLTKAERGSVHVPESWSRVHEELLFSAIAAPTAATGNEPQMPATLYTYRFKTATASPLPVRSTTPLNAEFSTDGKLIAYTQRGVSNTAVVTVEPYPLTGEKLIVNESSHHPVWSPDSQTLFYVPAASMLAGVRVIRQANGLAFGNPAQWSGKLPNVNPFGPPRNFDITPGGTQFVFTRPNVANDATGLRQQAVQVIFNWQQEMKKRLEAVP